MRSTFALPAALLAAAAYLTLRRDLARLDARLAPAPRPAGLGAAPAEQAATLAPAPPGESTAFAPAPPHDAPPRPPKVDEWVAPPRLRDDVDPSALGDWAAAVGDPRIPEFAEILLTELERSGLIARGAEPAPPPRAEELEPELQWVDEWCAPVAPLATPAPDAAHDAPTDDVARDAPADAAVVMAGRFVLGGWAVGPGHLAVIGVTFPERAGAVPARGRVRIHLEVAENVADGGAVVLDAEGFAPDREGFTLTLAAADAGSFAAAGRWELLSE